MRKIQNLMTAQGLLNQLGHRLAAQRTLAEQVRSCLPAPLDRQLQAAVLNGTTLVLFVDSPVWASRLRYQSPVLLRQLRERGITVDQLQTRILPARGVATAKRQKPNLLSEQSAELLRQTAEAIGEGELQEALRRLSRHRR